MSRENLPEDRHPTGSNSYERLLARGDLYSHVARVFQAGLRCTLSSISPFAPPDPSEYHTASLYFGPSKELVQRLALSGKELLCVVSTYTDVDYRIIQEPKAIIERAEGRLESDIVFLISRDPHIESKVREFESDEMTTYIAFHENEMEGLVNKGVANAWRSIDRQTATRDLYNLRSAITRSRNFFGRKQLLDTLNRDLCNNGTSVGVFGLRKVGKTSLLHQLFNRVKQTSEVVAAHLDLQVIDAVQPSALNFIEQLRQAIIEALPRKRRDYLGFDLAAEAHTSRSDDVFKATQSVVDTILRNSDRARIILFFDEIDLMFPRDESSPWASEFVRAWRFLRGLSQQHKGRICYFMTGTNPRILEDASVSGDDNPLLAWIDMHYLGCLEKSESFDMLTKLGGRMLLRWHDDALDFVWARTGGHPLLTRLFGSIVHHRYLGRDNSIEIDEGIAREQLPQLIRNAAPILNQILEMMREAYPNEYVMLQMLAESSHSDFKSLLRDFPQDIEHLRGYGLIELRDGDWTVATQLVEEWIQRRGMTKPNLSEAVRATGAGLELPDESLIEGYRVIRRIGAPGGFADVFQGEKISGTEGKRIAVKVYRGVSLGSLQRELDALLKFRHPNIVQVFDSGKSLDGRPFLTMELLTGRTLREFVSPSEALSESEARSYAGDILSALHAIHPNEQRVRELRMQESLDAQDYDALQQAKHGYVHRDIKPENIMVVRERGAILFDFNISSHAGEPVHTISMTPGYLPRWRNQLEWDPEVDLYALGLTIAQAATGNALAGPDDKSYGDLMDAVHVKLGTSLAEWIHRLCPAKGEDQWPSAQAALNALDRKY